MKLLVFDTCFNKSYIVLREDEKILNSKIIESNDLNYHSAYLIPNLSKILKENNLLIKDIEAIGINIGPGSFTGVRAGITIARVLAQQADIKLVGVPSLMILSRMNKSDKDTLVITDARKNKVYTALYTKDGTAKTEPKLEDKENIQAYINSSNIVITDSSIKEYLNTKNINSFCYENDDNNIGIYLSDITYQIILNNPNKDFHWAKVKPLYIQMPSITKPKEIKHV